MCRGSTGCECEGVRQDLLARVVGLQRTALQLSRRRVSRLLAALPLLRRDNPVIRDGLGRRQDVAGARQVTLTQLFCGQCSLEDLQRPLPSSRGDSNHKFQTTPSPPMARKPVPAPRAGVKRRVVCSPQAVHVLAAGAVGMVCTVVYNGSHLSPYRPSPFLAILYILSSSLHIGAQFWMTFVSGLTLYFSLSRHAFGDVQQVLFPRYFTLNSFLSSVTFLSFVKLHQHIPSWTFRHYLQGSCLAVGFLVESLARLYLAPKVLDAMARVRALELAVEGVGKEVGQHHPGQLSQCPLYNATYREFRRYHGLMAIANVLSISCSIAHLFHLASSLHFS